MKYVRIRNSEKEKRVKENPAPEYNMTDSIRDEMRKKRVQIELVTRKEAYKSLAIAIEQENTFQYNPNLKYFDRQKGTALSKPENDHPAWPENIDHVFIFNAKGNSENPDKKGNELECVINAEGDVVFLPHNINGNRFTTPTYTKPATKPKKK